MTPILDIGQSITLSGQSGAIYHGRIYNKASDEPFLGHAIVCLTNSTFNDHQWRHNMNSIFRTNDTVSTLNEFKNRDDISHLILISQHPFHADATDAVDDLIRYYIHQRTHTI
jgi:hypothetical protein